MHGTRSRLVAVVAVMGLSPVVSPTPARACGGFFCSNAPVDQNAERILFEIGDDGNVTAYIEIAYTGAPEAFSWIVPVPDTPALDVVSASTLRTLDVATAAQVIPPPIRYELCSGEENLLGGFSRGDVAGGAPEAADGGVHVEDLPQVGPFEPEVISSGDAFLLINWLNRNGYLITSEMEPFVAAYVEAGMKFLAMKLAPGAGVSDIAPIKMLYACPEAIVPLVLTAVAAEPEMGVIVMIASEGRYRAANWPNLVVDSERIRFDPYTSRDNYFALVSALIDAEGGQAAVTEMAQPTSLIDLDARPLFTVDAEQARGEAQAVLDRHPYLTRLYTRISAWEIGDDPIFESIPDDEPTGDISNIHDLSTRDEMVVNVCDTPSVEDRDPCSGIYCGASSSCAEVAGGFTGAGCRCAPGFVARLITNPAPSGLPAVACQASDFDMLESVEAQVTDPCAGVDCGRGSCVAVGGFPSCDCAEGAAAVAGFGSVRCDPITGKIYAPDYILEPQRAGCGCASDPGGGVVFAGLAIAALLRRRRRH